MDGSGDISALLTTATAEVPDKVLTENDHQRITQMGVILLPFSVEIHMDVT